MGIEPKRTVLQSLLNANYREMLPATRDSALEDASVYARL